MNKFIHDQNLKLFRTRLEETKDEQQRALLRDLIEEHEEKYRWWQLKPQPD